MLNVVLSSVMLIRLVSILVAEVAWHRWFHYVLTGGEGRFNRQRNRETGPCRQVCWLPWRNESSQLHLHWQLLSTHLQSVHTFLGPPWIAGGDGKEEKNEAEAEAEAGRVNFSSFPGLTGFTGLTGLTSCSTQSPWSAWRQGPTFWDVPTLPLNQPLNQPLKILEDPWSLFQARLGPRWWSSARSTWDAAKFFRLD